MEICFHIQNTRENPHCAPAGCSDQALKGTREGTWIRNSRTSVSYAGLSGTLEEGNRQEDFCLPTLFSPTPFATTRAPRLLRVSKHKQPPLRMFPNSLLEGLWGLSQPRQKRGSGTGCLPPSNLRRTEQKHQWTGFFLSRVASDLK